MIDNLKKSVTQWEIEPWFQKAFRDTVRDTFDIIGAPLKSG